MENPFQAEQAVVLLLLVAGGLVWRRVRPEPQGLVRGYMLVLAGLTTVGVLIMCSGGLDDHIIVCRAVFHALVMLTLFVYIETGRALRSRPIAEATARYLRGAHPPGRGHLRSASAISSSIRPADPTCALASSAALRAITGSQPGPT